MDDDAFMQIVSGQNPHGSSLHVNVTPLGYSIITLNNPKTGEPSLVIHNGTADGSAEIKFYDAATGKVSMRLTPAGLVPSGVADTGPVPSPDSSPDSSEDPSAD
ncbi:MAG: hypothetical protein AAF108_01200 [Planctomycetota bacterium]